MSNQKVTAKVLTEAKTFQDQSFLFPVTDSQDGMLQVMSTGLCGSDIASYLGEKIHDGPVILGHEVIGKLTNVGKEAAERWGFSDGDRVAIEEAIPCGSCPDCQAGFQRLCARNAIRYGYTSIDTAPSLWGGFSEYMYLHPQTQMHAVPENVSDALATLFIPLSNGLAWMHDSGELQPGEKVVVYGPGQHGIASAVAALRLGASEVVVVGTERSTRRLELARQLGCKIVAATGEAAEDQILDVLGGPADVVMDMTPRTSAPIESSLRLATTRGRVIWGGMKRGATQTIINPDLVAQKELTIRGVWARPSWAIKAALKWLSEDPRLGMLCEETYALSELDRAFKDAVSGAGAPLHSAILNS